MHSENLRAKKSPRFRGLQCKRMTVIPLLYRVWLVVHPSDPGAYRALQDWYSAGIERNELYAMKKMLKISKYRLKKKLLPLYYLIVRCCCAARYGSSQPNFIFIPQNYCLRGIPSNHLSFPERCFLNYRKMVLCV